MLAVAIFAVSVHPIRHAADLKPYATDLLVAWSSRCWRSAGGGKPGAAGRLWRLAGVRADRLARVAPGGVRRGRDRAGVAVAGLAVGRSGSGWRSRPMGWRWSRRPSGSTLRFTRDQASSARPGWARCGPRRSRRWIRPVGLVRWLAWPTRGTCWPIPCGGEGGQRPEPAGLAWSGRSSSGGGAGRTVLGVLLVAAGGGAGGGGAPALSVWRPGPAWVGGEGHAVRGPRALPADRAGGGAVAGLDPVRTAAIGPLRLGLVGLVAVGVVPWSRRCRRPYRAYQAKAAREFARRFWPEVGRGAEVACLRWDIGVAEWDSVRLGVAVSLCNQAIYSPSRRSGGPRWDRGLGDRPLRCVLGVARRGGRARGRRLAEGMRARLRPEPADGSRSTPPSRADAPRLERYEVFEFVPRPASVGQRVVELRAPALGDRDQAADDVLDEVGRGAVGVEGGLVVVLLVEEEPPRLGGRSVGLVEPAAGLRRVASVRARSCATASSSWPGLMT